MALIHSIREVKVGLGQSRVTENAISPFLFGTLMSCLDILAHHGTLAKVRVMLYH